MSNEPIDVVVQQDNLGMTVTSNLSWQAHVLKTHQKASKKLNMLKPMKFKLSVCVWTMQTLCGTGVVMLTKTSLKACSMRLLDLQQGL